MTKGRKSKPTALKVLAGNPGKRPLNTEEPQPALVLPAAPVDLSELGRAKWDELSALLYNQGILTELDLDLLFLYCRNYEEYTAASALVRINGTVLKSTNGNPFQNPYLSIANQAQERMLRILSLMGMTPADRSKVHASPKPAAESLAEKFFSAAVARSSQDQAPVDAPRPRPRTKARRPAERPAQDQGES